MIKQFSCKYLAIFFICIISYSDKIPIYSCINHIFQTMWDSTATLASFNMALLIAFRNVT